MSANSSKSRRAEEAIKATLAEGGGTLAEFHAQAEALGIPEIFEGACDSCARLNHWCDLDDPQDFHHPQCLVPLAKACQAAAEGKEIPE